MEMDTLAAIILVNALSSLTVTKKVKAKCYKRKKGKREKELIWRKGIIIITLSKFTFSIC